VRFVQAQLAVTEVLSANDHNAPNMGDLHHAARVIDGLKGLIDGLPAHKVAADFFYTASQIVAGNGHSGSASNEQLLGVEATPARLRAAAEYELRLCARYATGRETRVRYVDQANRVRPRTLW
jgi:hypothetical protein